jgi:hypothetical protein
MVIIPPPFIKGVAVEKAVIPFLSISRVTVVSPSLDKKIELFGKSRGDEMAKAANALLGQMPIVLNWSGSAMRAILNTTTPRYIMIL